ncbi:MAG: anion permease [Eubacteriaceae bacterium]|nr:anion permease [Eubacteriaceae bacterium]
MSSHSSEAPKSEVHITKTLVVAAVAAAISFIPPPEGLTVVSMRFIACFFFMVASMLANALPMWAAANMAGIAMVLFKILPFTTVYSAWSSSTIWMVLGVMTLATILGDTGLMRRIAFVILSWFPPNFAGTAIAITIASLVLGPIVPSSSAKMAILTPFAGTLGKEIGLKPNSKSIVGLWFLVNINVMIIAVAFLTGSNITFMLLGMLPAETSVGLRSWMGWFSNTWIWLVIMVAGSVLYTLFFMKPKEQATMSKDVVKKMLEDLGPMSRNEKISAFVLTFCVLLWLTSDIHKIDNGVVTWLGIFILVMFGLMTTADTYSKLPFGMIFMFAPMMGLIEGLTPLGITGFIAATLGPVLTALIPNGFVFVIVVVLVTFALRMFVDQISILAVAASVFIPIAMAMGINPWVAMFAMWSSSYIWIMPHNNFLVIQMSGLMGNVFEFKDAQPLTWIYMGLTLIGNIASVPLWMAAGML